MKKFLASWEIVNDDREDFGECDSMEFDTLDECKKWLGFRLDLADYYCIVFRQDNGHIALMGWMP